MKKLLALTAAALISASTVTFAESIPNDDPIYRAHAISLCDSISELAAIIMETRQAGMPRDMAFEKFANDDLSTALVEQAYDISYFETPRYKELITATFKDSHRESCINIMNE